MLTDLFFIRIFAAYEITNIEMPKHQVQPSVDSPKGKSKDLPALQTSNNHQPKTNKNMKNNETVNNFGIPKDKIQKYNWKLKNKRGVYLDIPKISLFIDGNYQRTEHANGKILTIAKEWNWISCGTLSVGDRNGSFYVIDGQHRKLAADKRSDIKELPCMVYETESAQQEAEAFVDINQHRANVKSVDQYRAAIVCKNPEAVFLDGIIKSSNMTVNSSGSTNVVACVGALLKMVKQDRERFSKIWPLFRAMHPDGAILSAVIKGVWFYEMELKESGKTTLNEPTHSKLIRLGGKVIASEIRRLSIELSKGGDLVFKQAVKKCLKMKI